MPHPAAVTLEPLRPHHAPEMLAGLGDPAGYRFLPDDPPRTLRSLVDRYARQAKGGPADGSEIRLGWVVRRDPSGEAVGYTQATIRAGSALLGYHLFPAFWRRGLGGEAVRLTLETLFARPDVDDVAALVDTRNRGSIALLRRLGLTLAGTLLAADTFKGTTSDEHEFTMTRAAWRAVRP